MTDAPDTALWTELVHEAYQLAYGERLAELNGRRPRTFDDRGLHPYSEVWGRIGLLTGGEITGAMIDGVLELPEPWPEPLVELVRDLRLSPSTLRRTASEAANREFRRQIKEGEHDDE